MLHSVETATATTIANLRRQKASGAAANNAPIVAQVYFSWDTDQGAVTLDLEAADDALLTITGQISNGPAWVTLNFGLGRGHFNPGDVIGWVFDLQASAAQQIAPFVRSATEDGTKDTFLLESLENTQDRQVQTLMHHVSAGGALAGAEKFHTLVLPLPHGDVKIDLFDLQVFVVPASQVAHLSELTLSGLSA